MCIDFRFGKICLSLTKEDYNQNYIEYDIFPKCLPICKSYSIAKATAIADTVGQCINKGQYGKKRHKHRRDKSSRFSVKAEKHQHSRHKFQATKNDRCRNRKPRHGFNKSAHRKGRQIFFYFICCSPRVNCFYKS